MVTVVIKDNVGKELLVERVDNLNDLMDAMLLDDDNVRAEFLAADISAACIGYGAGAQIVITVDAEFVGRYE